VLAQRHVDRLRAARRMEPLPDEEPSGAVPATVSDPERRLNAELLERALANALAAISDRDRLRLGCYYAQDMTLAETGRLLREHEATVSRQLARTRKALRENVEAYLRTEAGLSDAAIAECFESVLDDAGTIDLEALLPGGADCKNSIAGRSTIKRADEV
jgi:hypothetical protein